MRDDAADAQPFIIIEKAGRAGSNRRLGSIESGNHQNDHVRIRRPECPNKADTIKIGRAMGDDGREWLMRGEIRRGLALLYLMDDGRGKLALQRLDQKKTAVG